MAKSDPHKRYKERISALENIIIGLEKDKVELKHLLNQLEQRLEWYEASQAKEAGESWKPRSY